MFDFNTWIRQPTTIHGLAVCAAGIGGALAHIATGNPHVDAVIAVAAYVLVHLGIDDHSQFEQMVTGTVLDGAHAFQTRDVGPLVNDGATIARMIDAATTAPAAATPPTV
jgi:hypothetical protein